MPYNSLFYLGILPYCNTRGAATKPRRRRRRQSILRPSLALGSLGLCPNKECDSIIAAETAPLLGVWSSDSVISVEEGLCTKSASCFKSRIPVPKVSNPPPRQEVTRGMREAASRGFWVTTSRLPVRESGPHFQQVAILEQSRAYDALGGRTGAAGYQTSLGQELTPANRPISAGAFSRKSFKMGYWVSAFLVR